MVDHRIDANTRALRDLSASTHILDGDVDALARQLTELAAKATGVARASVWLFNDTGDELRCVDLYESSTGQHSSGLVRREQDFQNECHTVVEVSGKRFGLLCLEHPGQPHQWTSDEITFAARLADKIALTLMCQVAKRDQDLLRQNEERFRGYFDPGLIAMAITLPDKGIAEINGKFCEIFGYPREELLQMDWASLTHPDDLAADVDRFNRVLSGEIESYVLDKRFIRKGGATVYCTISVSGVRRADGAVDYIVALIQDITERKRAEEALHAALTSTVEAIAATIETRDPYTAGHQRSVADLAAAMAREMGLPADQIEGIHFGALIHDLGKIQVPAELLTKPTRLTRIEMELIKTHPQAGYEIVKDIKFPWPVAEMVHQHHERLDGTGYPRGLKGDAIALEARVLAVADAVDAMASHRPYRAGLGIDRALQELQSKRGIWFEPSAVDACVRLFRERGYTIKGVTFA